MTAAVCDGWGDGRAPSGPPPWSRPNNICPRLGHPSTGVREALHIIGQRFPAVSRGGRGRSGRAARGLLGNSPPGQTALRRGSWCGWCLKAQEDRVSWGCGAATGDGVELPSRRGVSGDWRVLAWTLVRDEGGACTAGGSADRCDWFLRGDRCERTGEPGFRSRVWGDAHGQARSYAYRWRRAHRRENRASPSSHRDRGCLGDGCGVVDRDEARVSACGHGSGRGENGCRDPRRHDTHKRGHERASCDPSARGDERARGDECPHHHERQHSAGDSSGYDDPHCHRDGPGDANFHHDTGSYSDRGVPPTATVTVTVTCPPKGCG